MGLLFIYVYNNVYFILIRFCVIFRKKVFKSKCPIHLHQYVIKQSDLSVTTDFQTKLSSQAQQTSETELGFQIQLVF